MHRFPRFVILLTALSAAAFVGGCDRDDDIAFARRPKDPAPQAAIDYKTPSGWSEIPDSVPPRVLAFRAGEAEVVVTRFAPNNAGSFADNVTRWRGQLGLAPIEDPRSTPMKEITLAGETPGVLLEFHNPANAKRMLVIMASSGGEMWFVKITGPADVVDTQRANFDAFVKSMDLRHASETQ